MWIERKSCSRSWDRRRSRPRRRARLLDFEDEYKVDEARARVSHD